MLDSTQYQLLDFGDGRRLERFGAVVLDRPCPAAEADRPAAPLLWSAADARFERLEAEQGRWILRGDPPRRWTIAHGRMTLELKRTDFGHVGLFPEQAENWDWIAQQVRHSRPGAAESVKVLNLFAHTGGSTLAAAAAGAAVTHVDAARNIVTWARGNAELSALADAPIRWIAEDVVKFVQREVRRGNRYDAVILDPPSYGHGTHGEAWRLAADLPRLLALCAELTAPRPRFVLLTCHTPGLSAARLRELLATSFGTASSVHVDAAPLALVASTARALPSGVVARWGDEIAPNFCQNGDFAQTMQGHVPGTPLHGEDKSGRN
jgi:23S rRNA (cytosine1962-C5)-methyltransferase